MATATQSLTKYQVVERALREAPIEQFKALLPDLYKPHAVRFMKRAQLYLETTKNSAKLLACTPASIGDAILLAAERGIPIDGKMGHLVPFKDQAVFMPDYKALVAIGRRHGAFIDAYARLVFEGDRFKWGMRDGDFFMRFEPTSGDRGEIVQGFAVIKLGGGHFSMDVMSKAEIDYIRSRSRAANDGPWVDFYEMMARKTVLRRAIGTYSDDPDMLELVADDDKAVGFEKEKPISDFPEEALATPTLPRLDNQAANKPLERPQEQHQDEPPADYVPSDQDAYEPAPRQQAKPQKQELRQPIDSNPRRRPNL